MTAITSYQRILGIDYGSRRIGLSISDPLCLIAQPIEALQNNQSLFTNLKRLINSENIKTIVVGMPLNLKGQHGKKADEVQEFIELLRNKLYIEVTTWDERFTTTIAQNTMLVMGTKKKERQKKDGRIDSMAAAVMLQGFLDSARQSHSC
jgi:putative Holliday junction resolvase